MGVVYRARDTVMAREVALKTIRGNPSQVAIDLFRKECSVLAAMSHPNIVEIFDIGDFEEDGAQKPYFVMPLLRGQTLADLIRNASQHLTLERTVEIVLQTCRGLHAAHERGLVHRDLKPNNIFVLPDDSAKIIDFGVAHMADSGSTMTVKGGTLLYMAPEQIEMKPASPSFDIFALGVVFYEVLTGRRPFAFPTEQETIDAILHLIPPPASEVNPSVPVVYGRIAHKAIAKQPWNRFSSVKEMAETIQKARRNEPIEIFDTARLAPRVLRAAKAFEQGNLAFAAEILGELEAAGEIDPTISDLRRRLDTATRQKTLSQLLESARTCIEEEEFLLALQKVQEVLQLDPQNATALGMRNTIEVRRNEHKVEEWLRLARRHLENQAFTHAREALDNILKIAPGDPSAYQLMAEVDRREEQHNKARQDKDNLYQGALQAWKNGDVSSALSKLERLVALDQHVPDGGERSISYQNFYNEVRSEQDLMRNSYQEARATLADGNYSAAHEICNQYLAKYPGHALFQALKFDVEEKERQAISSRIAEVDRQVDAEPDLDRRAHLLRAALEQFPGEPHFERALRLARDKRDLVNGIVAKARAYEEQGQYNEALGQLEILGTIHKSFPGLEFDIERLRKRREQQTLSEAKARWVDQIDRHLESADYARAMELIAKAMGEFPDDPEMLALETMAKASQARAGEAVERWKQGQELCGLGRFGEGIDAFRHAFKLDGHNAAVRTSLLQTLTQQARALLDQDWQMARRISEEALAVDPGYTPAKSVHTLTLDREREDSVAAITAECRRLQSTGEYSAALSLVEHGLTKYPKELRLSQLQTTLRKAAPAQPERAVAAGAAVAPPPQAPSPQAPEPAEPARIETPAPAQSLAAPPGEATVAPPVAAPGNHQGLTELLGAHPATVAPAPEAPAPAPPARPAAKPPSPRRAPKPPAVPKPAAPRTASAIRSMPWWIWAAGAVALPALLASSALLIWPSSVDVRTQPDGATVRVDGAVRGQSNTHFRLRPGRYHIELSKNGFITSASVLEVKRWSSASVNIALQPVPVEPVATVPPTPAGLRISSDLASGELSIDGGTPVPLQEGQLTLDQLPTGKHVLTVRSGRAQAVVPIRAEAGAQAEIDGVVSATDLRAVVVTAMGGHAQVYSPSFVSVSVDGHPAGNAGPAGVELKDLAEGAHEFSLQEGKNLRKVQLQSGPAPLVTLFLASDRNVGAILVLTGESGVHVVVDGKEQHNLTQGGQLHIANLAVSSHTVRVFKEGFQEEAPAQVAVNKGEEARLEFRLKPLPTQSSLSIRGAPPGAEVRIDHNLAGTVQADGTFSNEGIAPGQHDIEIRARRFKTKEIRPSFRAGVPVVIAGADAAMERSTGVLQIAVQPESATVTYARAGEEAKPVSGGTMELDEGSYTVTASAPGYVEQSQTVQIEAGKTESVALRLPARVVAPVTFGIDAWPKGTWVLQDQWYVHRGGNFVLFPITPVFGSLTFTASRHGRVLGSSRIEWVVNFVDPNNYILFEMDKKSLYRTLVRNGERHELSKTPIPVPPTGNNVQFTLRIDISAAKVESFVQGGNRWLPLDTMNFDGPTLLGKDRPRGSFGFHLPGSDELMISGFTFNRKP